MNVSSTYFLEKSIRYIFSHWWPWGALAALGCVNLLSIGCVMLPFGHYCSLAVMSFSWTVWGVAVSSVVLRRSDTQDSSRVFMQGLMNGLFAWWYPLISACILVCFASAAFSLPSYIPVEYAFFALLFWGIIALMWWVVGFIIQPHIACGDYCPFSSWRMVRSLSYRDTLFLGKLSLVIAIFGLFGALLVVQFLWIIEYGVHIFMSALGLFVGHNWLTMLFSAFVLRAIIFLLQALWYALYAICAVFFYEHVASIRD